ncbi:DUF2283 domain-containing protein [Dactylosporangium sp. NPDC049140]|uniref:DUF2283 domain-containing protein n=1 Tax=Dactylosporangium sp. NPDC049140 TaxID=3155647 RepID=UPI0033E4F408
MTVYKKATIPLVCTYDDEADAAYVHLQHPIADAGVDRTITFDSRHGMLNLDLDARGHVLGLEIIGARAHLPPALLQAVLDAER